MIRAVAILLTLALLLTGGIVHGLYSDRWRTTRELEDGIERLPSVPLEVADWKGEEQPTKDDEFAQAGATGYWSRIYRKEKHEILVILMVGRAGRMSVHTPEVCYQGAGYKISGSPRNHKLLGVAGDEVADFRTANFVKPGQAHSELQLFWTWNAGEGWTAPINPRWQFAGKPALYKLYFSHAVAGLSASTPKRQMEDFLRSFIPALEDALKTNRDALALAAVNDEIPGSRRGRGHHATNP